MRIAKWKLTAALVLVCGCFAGTVRLTAEPPKPVATTPAAEPVAPGENKPIGRVADEPPFEIAVAAKEGRVRIHGKIGDELFDAEADEFRYDSGKKALLLIGNGTLTRKRTDGGVLDGIAEWMQGEAILLSPDGRHISVHVRSGKH
jgi:hypothetical protein